MTIKEAIRKCTEKLNNTDSPVREARLLVGLAVGMTLSEVIIHEDMQLTPATEEALMGFLARRQSGEPFAYISGKKEFMGLTFKVDKNTLIPRPDTEMLVNLAVGKEKTLLDLCTGSGCVAVSLAKLMPWAQVTAVDISSKALDIARENSVANGVFVDFIKKDILKNKIRFDKKFQVVTANPPYIESSVLPTLMEEVRDFEPMRALDGGEDGLVFYRKIVEDAPLFLEEGGKLCFEIGQSQGKAVSEIMQEKFENINVTKDYAGLDRVVTGTLKKSVRKTHDHAGHRERFRTRYLQEGLNGFHPHEILEFLLFYAIPRQDVNAKAHELIKTFGSLSAVLDASPEDLMKYGNLSENTAVLLNIIPAVFRRYMQDKWKEKPMLSDGYVAGRYAVDLFVGVQYEEFYVICLDTNKAVIKSEKICEGTLNETAVYPRIVIETALKNKADSIILAHNHPSGSLKPSWNDVEITRKIDMAVKSIDITLVDHIIVGGDKFTSMAQGGYMNK